MELIGIENEAEFFPAGTLSDVLKDELQDITSRWAGLDKSAHPIERLTGVASSATEALRQIRNTSDRVRQAELIQELHHLLLSALGYDWKRQTAITALQGNPTIPLVGRVADGSGKPALWIIETPVTDVRDEAADPLGAKFDARQFPEDVVENALLDQTIEEMLADGVFELLAGPRNVLVLGLSQVVLVDKRKWPARSVLRFDLQEIFARADRDTLTVMACLISREARVPDQGVPISDRLEEEAQRNANAVTSSLKRTVRDAIELLGQEVLEVTGGKYPSSFPDKNRRGVWIDGPELSRECLRYMYRLLFLFYAEANPRLNLLDLQNPIYASGYSVEALRELESTPLRTTADRDGTFLWDSLQTTLGLLYSGRDLIDEEKGTGLRLPPVKVSLLDPKSTPLLSGLRLRNEAIQKVIRLLSLRSTGKNTGRISYAKLGIGQLGAVYETLISFTGVVAKTDLIELKPRKGRSSATDDDQSDNATDAHEDDGEEIGDEIDTGEEDEVFRRDKVDLLAPSWFVPRSRIGGFDPEEIVFRGSEALVYPKGTFIYRLAGRDREKSASYYTPEPLARLLVKHALMERCRDLKADELLELKILEPAMGSAAFLVETTNQLADLYLERKQKEVGKTIPQDQVVIEKQKVRAFIADRNCFGVDMNPIAVELGAISLWLNSLHASDFSPWFGDQLHAGNSLIGARRASYPANLLHAKKQTDLWLNFTPHEIGWRKRLPDGQVWQWLLPAKDMANFDKDKSIAPFARDAQEQIKAWRKGGFFKKLEAHEIKLVQKLSRVADALFDQVAEDLANTRGAANDEITLWPDTVMPGNKGMDFHDKARLIDRLVGADHATNTLPYKRLKTAMDAWCALWLWPLDKADKLPSRAEFLQGMAMILEGGFTADGSLAAPSVEEFSDPAPDFFDHLEPDAPARDLFRAAEKRQKGLFRETNVEALIESFEWIKTAVEVAERERFVHFDLIFADLMKTRGGFDLIVGNPPWAKPSWNEGEVIAEFEPSVKIRNLKASQIAAKRTDFINSANRKSHYLTSYTSTKGAINITASGTMYPFIGGGQNNLYRCFIDLAFRTVSPIGIVALIHQDGHLFDPKADGFRRHWYQRITRHFEFLNRINSKNFSEVGPEKRFSLNVYRGEPGDIDFLQFTTAFLASQIEDSFVHDGVGELPALKDANGKWETRGHRDRIIRVTPETLEVIAALAEEDANQFETTRFLQPYSERMLGVFDRMARAGTVGSQAGKWQMARVWDESIAGKDPRLLRSQTAFPAPGEERIISGPMIYVGNPLFKTPRAGCKSNRDYDVLDFTQIGENYFPRTNFRPGSDLSLYKKNLPKCRWDPTKNHSDFFRLAFRKMIAVNSERSLIGAIIPPSVVHISAIESVAFKDPMELLNAATLCSSLVYDFFIKAKGRSDFYSKDFSDLPWLSAPSSALQRMLRLTCLTREYSSLWSETNPLLSVEPWSLDDPRLVNEHAAGSSLWSYDVAVRSDFARRMALVEIDVLVAMALGLRIDQLIEIYRTYFPILQDNEDGTWYDGYGRIVWSCSVGLPNVGYLSDNNKNPSRAAWEKVVEENPSELTCTTIDDTMPGGPREVTRHFVGPFTKCDRIEDYRRAWAHFERLKSEEAA